ncbi:thymidylate kinase-domain-containing protein [Peziza echinospora]|nr:thymidylate kinase-domain-containing protein [Peziza echinospora]
MSEPPTTITTTAAPSPPRRGALISIEGLDRAGKSTQCTHLLAHLLSQGHPVHLQKFPDRTTPIGLMIDQYLRSGADLEDHAIHLLFSANRWELAGKLRGLLAGGTTVVMDRYIHSGIVFTAAKGIDVGWCEAPERGLPRPDVVVFLDVEGEVAEARGGYGEERYERREVQERVRGLFGVVGGRDGHGGGEEGWWRRVDAGREVEVVRREVCGIVEEVVGRVGRGEAGEVGVYE